MFPASLGTGPISSLHKTSVPMKSLEKAFGPQRSDGINGQDIARRYKARHTRDDEQQQ